MSTPFFGDNEKYVHEIDCPVLIVKFTNDDFDKLFCMKADEVKSWFSSNGETLESFNFKDGLDGNDSENIVLFYEGIDSGDFEVFGYNLPNGPHPERWQDRDDYKDWLEEEVFS